MKNEIVYWVGRSARFILLMLPAVLLVVWYPWQGASRHNFGAGNLQPQSEILRRRQPPVTNDPKQLRFKQNMIRQGVKTHEAEVLSKALTDADREFRRVTRDN